MELYTEKVNNDIKDKIDKVNIKMKKKFDENVSKIENINHFKKVHGRIIPNFFL